VSAVSGEVISAVVEAAIQAPSGDNCQPWHFRWDGEHLRILFLAGRAESLYDIRSLASWISLGAVVTNMTLAAAQFGFHAAVELFPAGAVPGTVAVVRFETGSVAADQLAEAIPARCVNRRPYRQEPLPAGVREELQALAASYTGTRLSWVDTEPAKGRIAALAAQNDRILFENRALHDGVYSWIRWTRAEAERRRDGMPAETLELGPLERPGMRLLGSWRWARLAAALRISRVLPARARRIYQRSGAIALLSVRGDQPADFVHGGEVLERIWLTATRHGIAFQPITGITFLLLRMRLAGGEGLGTEHRKLLDRISAEFKSVLPEGAAENPIMLFRLGLAPPPSGRAPRLPLEQILESALPPR
jgi:nitroreductase